MSEPAAAATQAVRESPLILASPLRVPTAKENMADVLLPPGGPAAPVPRNAWRLVASGAGMVVAGILLGAMVCVGAPILIAGAVFEKGVEKFDRAVPLSKAIAPFLSRAPQWRETVSIEALALTQAQTQTFAYFLRRMNRDVRKLSHCAELSDRLMEITVAMQGDPELTALLTDTMHDMLTACGDRRNRGLNELHLALLTHRAQQAPDAEQALRELARQLLRLDVVHACAAARSSSDAVERYLQFEAYVNAQVPLPLWTTDARYTQMCRVPRRELDAAAQAAARVTDAHVENYLKSWAPWQKHMRGKMAQDVRYDMLPRTACAQDPHALCPITLIAIREIDEAVLQTTTSTPQVYDFHALMRWWVMHGTDPVTRQALALVPGAI